MGKYIKENQKLKKKSSSYKKVLREQWEMKEGSKQQYFAERSKVYRDNKKKKFEIMQTESEKMYKAFLNLMENKQSVQLNEQLAGLISSSIQDYQQLQNLKLNKKQKQQQQSVLNQSFLSENGDDFELQQRLKNRQAAKKSREALKVKQGFLAEVHSKMVEIKEELILLGGVYEVLFQELEQDEIQKKLVNKINKVCCQQELNNIDDFRNQLKMVVEDNENEPENQEKQQLQQQYEIQLKQENQELIFNIQSEYNSMVCEQFEEKLEEEQDENNESNSCFQNGNPNNNNKEEENYSKQVRIEQLIKDYYGESTSASIDCSCSLFSQGKSNQEESFQGGNSFSFEQNDFAEQMQNYSSLM